MVRTILVAVIACKRAAISAGVMTALLTSESTSVVSMDYCTPNSGAAAVDLSEPVNFEFLEKMQSIGVQTIIRYYDHEDETILGKTLRKKERDLIIQKGFSIAVVFQHNNDQFSSFTSARGQADAERSLILAAENLQPKGSAIYFGVDGPWSTDDEIASIKAYFTSINDVLKGQGYRVGIYGSGLVCKQLVQGALADLCWLANAASWPGYQEYRSSMRWNLLQRFPTDCWGREVDFDVTNGRDYGQFAR